MLQTALEMNSQNLSDL